MTYRFQVPDDAFSRDRFLIPPDPKLVQERLDVPAGSDLEDLASMESKASKVLSKSQKLLVAISEANRDRVIPVPEAAIDVRAAVSRLNSTDGSQITFQLWMSLSAKPFDKAANIDPVRLCNELTGETLTDSRRITTLSGESPLLPHIAQFGVVAMANRLMGVFSGPEQAAKASAKLPPGVEIPSLLVQMAVSFAAWKVVQGLQGSDGAVSTTIVEDLLASTGASPGQIGTALSQARLYPQDPLPEMAESDEDTIRRFATAWLETNNQSGYEGWYRTPGLLELNFRVGLANQTSSFWAAPNLNPDQQFPDDVLHALDCEVEAANAALDRAAASLSHPYTRQGICCLIRVVRELGHKIGQPDMAYLQKFRSLLSMYLALNKAFGIGGLLTGLARKWEGLLRTSYNRALSIMLRRAFHSLASPIVSLLRHPDLEVLRVCPMFSDMLELTLTAIEELKQKVVEFLVGLYLDIQIVEDKWVNLDLKLPVAERCRSLISVIDALSAAVADGFGCAGSEADINVLGQASLVDQVGAVLPQPVVLPAPIGDQYVDFVPVRWETDGLTIPPLSGGVEGPESPDGTRSLIRAVTDCIGRIPRSSVPTIKELRKL